MAENLQEMTLAELKELARARIGRGHSRLRTKSQLVDALSNAVSQDEASAAGGSAAAAVPSEKHREKAASGKAKAAKASTKSPTAAKKKAAGSPARASRKSSPSAKGSDALSAEQASLLDAFSAALDGLSETLARRMTAGAPPRSPACDDENGAKAGKRRKATSSLPAPDSAKAGGGKSPSRAASRKQAKEPASSMAATGNPGVLAATVAEAAAPYSAARSGKAKASRKKASGGASSQGNASSRSVGILGGLSPHAVSTSASEGTLGTDAVASDPFPVESTPTGAAVPLRLEDEGLGELPDSYDEERMSLVSKGPYSLYLYWDFSKDTLSMLARTEGVSMCLRLYADGRMVRELECTAKDRSWYFKGLQPGLAYQVELMVVDAQGNATRIGVPSNSVVLPEVGPSKTIDDRFGTVVQGSGGVHVPACSGGHISMAGLATPSPASGVASSSRFSEALRDALFKASGGEIPSSICSSEQFAFGTTERPGQCGDDSTSPTAAWGALLPADGRGDAR